MPGGRLTHEDRRTDRGVAGRRARVRRDRPTARPADVHDQSRGRTQRRTRRLPGRPRPAGLRRPCPPAQARPVRAVRRDGGDEQPAEAVRDFVDQFATLLAATGLPRMTSRVFVCLLTADADGLTAADLVRRLQVSPGVGVQVHRLPRRHGTGRAPSGSRRAPRAVRRSTTTPGSGRGRPTPAHTARSRPPHSGASRSSAPTRPPAPGSARWASSSPGSASR